MTSGGFLIPLFPRYSSQANPPSVRSPNTSHRLIQLCTGDYSTDKEFDNLSPNVRYKANK